MKKWTAWLTAPALLATLVSAPVQAAEDSKVMDNVDKALVVDVEDQGSEYLYRLLVDGQVKPYHTNNKSFIPQEGQFVSLKAKDDRIVDFRGVVAVQAVQEKVMAKDTTGKTLDLELSGTVQLASNYAVYQNLNGQTIQKSLSDVYVGANNVSVYFDAYGKVNLIIIDGQTVTDQMRIGIMNSGFASLEHAQLDFSSADGLVIADKKAGLTYNVAPNTVATFVSTTTGTKVTVGGAVLLTSANRLYVNPVNETSKITINTFNRAYGKPAYRGFFEVTPSTTAGKLNVVNEVQMENYLTQVVPSEMPASFGLQALKSQAVAARTYALSDYFSSRYSKRGFHVDDSTLSQVYNNSAENALTTQAVQETKGMVMEDVNGGLVDARYYSTSGGFGAGRHEVWSDANGQFPGTPVNYLTAHSYVYDPANPSQMYNLNTQDEAALSSFYKNLSFKGYDSESYYFRWKVNFSRTELEKTINSNLAGRYTADPKFILTKDAAGNFVSKAIPTTGIGTLKNLYVAKRGAGGNMMELVVEGTTGTYKIVKEYNIRFTVRPSKTYTGSTSSMLLYRAKGGSTNYDTAYTLSDYTILPSAFATFDIARAADTSISNVTFYGGGNGHGVGMSQYGASSLGALGWDYQQILNSYYAGMKLTSIYNK